MKLPVRRRDIRVAGFLFSGVACGLKDDGRKDVALIFAEEPAAAAGAFTTNRFAAPPVRVARERLRGGRLRAVLVNTKSANAGTGAPGLARARACCALAARLLGIAERRVVPCSTGKIGLPLSWSKMARGIRLAVAELSPRGLWDAAEAIRTTDAFPKVAAREISIGGRCVTVAGLAKGAGMIEPRMATTLCYVLTDAACEPALLRALLRDGLAGSFNAISVDGDTSTNDTALLLASGASGASAAAGSRAARTLGAAVGEVLGELARLIVADGEGASKVVRVAVRGARSRAEADAAARAVANSLLVKTAIHGADPNWGRIACALGYSGAVFRPDKTVIRIAGVEVSRAAQAAGKAAERRARRAMLGREFAIEIDLGAGAHAASVLTCDLGVDYVRFNSTYSS
ncbi:MAG: bifunctional glutamate N-acetyltransferase/amino-acid acetyltransferase ArgJ [Deltaproteobacteria bacterium]|nr:bifunctional glutamate N-acetyltransferase/amino-acid acetyltransferase ArgJ [Deltaproteobacteria bacterium]